MLLCTSAGDDLILVAGTLRVAELIAVVLAGGVAEEVVVGTGADGEDDGARCLQLVWTVPLAKATQNTSYVRAFRREPWRALMERMISSASLSVMLTCIPFRAAASSSAETRPERLSSIH